MTPYRQKPENQTAFINTLIGEDESTKSWLYRKAAQARECASGMSRKTESADDVVAAMLRERARRKPVSAEEIREYKEWGRR